MSDKDLVCENEPPPTPAEGNLYCSEVDMGDGEVGSYVEWRNTQDGWILAKDRDSFVLLDNNA
jgi:hypothetical protein